MNTDDDQSKVAELTKLTERAYELVQYTRTKQEKAPIALAERHDSGHVENDPIFKKRREELLKDVQHLLEIGWDSFEYYKLQSKLERRKPTVAPGMVHCLKGYIRCRCWWDAKDELQELAEYLQTLKDNLVITANEKVFPELDHKMKSCPNTALLPEWFFLIAITLSVTLVLIVFLLTHNLIVTGSILFAAMLLFSLLGGFYLRHEKSLSEKNFLQLVGMVFRQIPLLFKAKNK
jgi:hypothetical protein